MRYTYSTKKIGRLLSSYFFVLIVRTAALSAVRATSVRNTKILSSAISTARGSPRHRREYNLAPPKKDGNTPSFFDISNYLKKPNLSNSRFPFAGLFFRCRAMFCVHEENIYQKRNRIQNYRKNKNILIISGFVNNQIRNLIAC